MINKKKGNEIYNNIRGELEKRSNGEN